MSWQIYRGLLKRHNFCLSFNRGVYMSKKIKHGQALVEFALVFPFILLIVVGGMIDFGFALYNFISLQQVANDTAQWAADRNQLDQSLIIQAAINNASKLGWNVSGLVIHPIEFPDFVSGGVTEKGVKVTLTFNSPTFTPFYQTLVMATTGASTIPLTTMATYKVLRKR